ncbi:MAG: ribosomal protein S18-alanine N-acetyltransferase [Deltaproteobacteria bacterium]|nr:ribosomal protein S18-alanine N-acetyltransferase [Deltaproteobacteria bacterium]
MKTSDLVYRRLTEEDLPDVAVLEAVCFPTPWNEDQYRAVLRQGGCALFGALRGGALAGYIAVSMLPDDAMEIYNIAVAPAFRRLGIGKKLLRLSMEAAFRNGAEQAVLEVRISNDPALALYRSLGFVQAGVRKGYYHDTGEDALVFIRPLAGRNGS